MQTTAPAVGQEIDRTLARHTELPLSAILAAHRDLGLEALSKDGKSWVVHFRGAEFKERPDSGVLSSLCGSGRSTDVAQIDLCAELSGKLMVIDSNEGRKMFQLPNKVVLD